ncbi:two component, sigma54 specific, transcriptional regulator, Fis family [Geobacter metallireducens RCH3]|uniref:Sigma-54-dependent transcriptional response regulator PilR n=1 Tax=Geobacter metallireducens (strain ATCC 53774 / DSM 7210 / GS-15) TaxID=269799 RepID=Q39VU3_GEOMG|nr:MULTISPECIES: sigma-54 dependent transcriptional regulator [Geobacter]ABB31631.1 sigma-54-dependent transcriptional response regulator PilR [Geobacter metallireducens GS-15]EHP86608.1 two component, sigma54 specific, transcriptional regulator, Fis family [Geobacter metallireducens RCH3]MBT1075415.1 sigma-54 dependent transcriptional regulator [Geobacter grbiciae]
MEIRILVVDDELSMREFLAILLKREGYAVDQADCAEKALEFLDSITYDLVISDVKMPGLDGIALLGRIKENSPDTAVLMMTAFSTAEQAVEAMKLGAYDYIAKPFKVEEVKVLVRNALEKRDLKRENQRLRQEVQERYGFSGLIGKSKKMRELYSLIERVAPSIANVLILGESGTGKELVARAIHYNSPRKDKAFVAVNCGAIPETLMESELFGHKKGSFTGAINDRAGLFEQAGGGTLFLDEIGEVPLQLQAKLLRVLQEKEFRRVGGVADQKADVRIVAASNRNLEEQVREGSFREDLFYRLNVVQLQMPPLRERTEDIPLLVEHFYRKYVQSNRNGEIITPGALKILMSYPFPGNVRELENLVERCMVLGGGTISEESLPPQVRGSQKSATAPVGDFEIPSEGMDLEGYLDGIEKRILLQALERCGGVKKKAAELLGLTFRSFRYRLAKFGMDEE